MYKYCKNAIPFVYQIKYGGWILNLDDWVFGKLYSRVASACQGSDK